MYFCKFIFDLNLTAQFNAIEFCPKGDVYIYILST